MPGQFKSAETVADSDSGSESPAPVVARAHAKAGVKRKATSPQTQSKRAKLGAEPVVEKRAVNAPKPIARDVVPASSDSESDSDSDSDSAKDVVNDVESKEDGDESSSSSSSNASESDDDDDDEPSQSRSTSLLPAPQTIPTAAASVQSTPSKPRQKPTFQPPPGFAPYSSTPNTSSQSSLLNASNLAGKQIWHLIVPSSVKLDNLKQINLNHIKTGAKVLSHNGDAYSLVNENYSNHNFSRILIPAKDGKSYTAIEKGLTQTLQLEQILELPQMVHTYRPPIRNVSQATAEDSSSSAADDSSDSESVVLTSLLPAKANGVASTKSHAADDDSDTSSGSSSSSNSSPSPSLSPLPTKKPSKHISSHSSQVNGESTRINKPSTSTATTPASQSLQKKLESNTSIARKKEKATKDEKRSKSKSH